MKNNILVLSFEDPKADNYFLDCINKIERFQTSPVLNSINLPLRVIRKAHMFSRIPGICIWFTGWQNKIDDVDCIICMASIYSGRVLKWIRRKNKSIKLINYYWDKMSVSGYKVEETEDYDNWTFDLKDSREYGINYNPQFFVQSIVLPRNEIKYDISFVGSDRRGRWKERTEIVENCYKEFLETGCKLFFYYVSPCSGNTGYTHKNNLPQREYFRIFSESKAVLEIVQPGEEWITLRVMQALTNGKKLITNNRWIKNEPYYSGSNIFIYGEDDIERLNEFIKEPFEDIDQSILAYYSITEWGNRFYEHSCNETGICNKFR